MDKKQYNVMVCFGQLVTKMFYKDIASLHTKIFANPELVFSPCTTDSKHNTVINVCLKLIFMLVRPNLQKM